MIENKTTTLTVSVNYFCNQKCIFCVDGTKTHLKYLSNQIDEKVLKLLKSGQGIYDKVVFTSGEPTLNKSLSLYIKNAKILGYNQIGIITNGTLLTNNLLDSLYKSGLTEITLSIHGSNSTLHYEMTQVKGSFEKVLKSMLLIKKNYNNLILNTSFVLNNKNLNNLYDFIFFVNKFGVNNILINTMRPIFHGNDNIFNNLTIKYSHFIDYINSLGEIKKEKLNFLLNKKILRIMDIPICILKEAGLSIEGYSKLEIMVTNIENKEIQKNDLSIDDNNRFKQYIKKCSNCSYYLECEGIYLKYLELYGENEFKTIIINKFNLLGV